MADVDYEREIANAFNSGNDRYWIHGFQYPQMRRICELLQTDFPGAQLHEYSDLDVCVFCRFPHYVDITAMEQIAHQRVKLVSQGRTRNLPA
ncbi:MULTISPECIES: hypothetical protein [Rhizobium]|uniref:Uncharacterized protein n=1 Tax=Rhizobium aouanii TaxID=3118145 RepID=A0ABU8CJE9_9HYPH|nr:hypothetical protein [Rhizobium acaciae]MCW1410745.1 hypothetical protein [Rhizobium acaciae]MCW1742956.1 hypothetical protein [Rhizobium acaciae]MCW1750152.1 hypothetical protein [Rhizobium acaciae]